MKHNVGGADRAVRFIVGLVLLALGIFVLSPVVWRAIFIVAGGILFVTAVIRYCPINHLLGVNTCPITKVAEKVTKAKDQVADVKS